MSVHVALKWIITATLVVAASEVAKRSSVLGALIASLPLTSLLALTWLWVEKRDAEFVAQWSIDVLWFVVPSLAFFVVFPPLMRLGWSFGASMAVALLALFSAYGLSMLLMSKVGGA